MKIPQKISPGSIKDSIVEIKYASKLPFEVALGMFYKSLDDTFQYTNRPISKQQLPSALALNFLEKLEIQIGSRHLFFNDKIKIELQPNSIILNSLNEYVSWDVYRLEIEKVLSQISKAEVIEHYTRIGVRYISEYPNIDLKDCIKFSFSFGMPDVMSDTFTFRSEFHQNDLKIILNLRNKLSVLSSKEISNRMAVTQISNIDIDVIMENITEESYETILSKIEIVHQKEKEVFFNLLSETFLESLKPVY